MASQLPFLPFELSDNHGSPSALVNLKSLEIVQGLKPNAILNTLSSSETLVFLRTFLRNRYRFYEADDIETNVRSIDIILLQILTTINITMGMKVKSAPALSLQFPIFLDIVALYGPSNDTVVSDMLNRAIKNTSNIESIWTEFFTIFHENSLGKNLIKSILSSKSGDSIDSIISFLCDSLFSFAQVTRLSPNLCLYYLSQFYTETKFKTLYQFMEIYEQVVPELFSLRAGFAGVDNDLTDKLRLITYSIILIIHSLIDSLLEVLRHISSRSAPVIDVYTKYFGQADPKNILSMVTNIVETLRSTECDAVPFFINKTERGGKPNLLFSDLTNSFQMRDSIEHVLSSPALRGQSTDLLRIFSEAYSSQNFSNQNTEQERSDITDVSDSLVGTILDMFPNVSKYRARQCLEKCGYHLDQAIEYLLTLPPEPVLTLPVSSKPKKSAISDELKYLTKALAHRQELEEIERLEFEESHARKSVNFNIGGNTFSQYNDELQDGYHDEAEYKIDVFNVDEAENKVKGGSSSEKSKGRKSDKKELPKSEKKTTGGANASSYSSHVIGSRSMASGGKSKGFSGR